MKEERFNKILSLVKDNIKDIEAITINDDSIKDALDNLEYSVHELKQSIGIATYQQNIDNLLDYLNNDMKNFLQEMKNG